MKKHTIAALALLVIASLTACGGSGGQSPIPSTNPGKGAAAAPTPAGGTTLVGVGDSLTFGEQSNGMLGTPTTSSESAYPGGLVYPTQWSGFFAVLFDCYSSIGTASCNHTPYSITDPTPPSNPSLAVLPLIAAPGLGTQIVLNTALFADVQSGCSTINDAAFGESSWKSTRVNPSIGIADLGVPGITMHEALNMTGPYIGAPVQTSSGCGYATLPNDPTSGGLESLVQSENSMFLPVLGEFQTAYGSNTTEVNVAVGMKPKLTTVWLGANDVLKYIFSAGTAPTSDTPSQMQTDLTSIVKQIAGTGSKVLVADLPDILEMPQFFPQGTRLIDDLATLLEPSLGSVTAAEEAATAINTYIGTQYGVTSGGYLTETGFLDILENCSASPSTCLTPTLDPSTPGSGLGSVYITPAFAAKISALNTAYNTVIDGVANGSGSNVALVPISTTFQDILTSGGVTLAPGETITLQFGGGFVSWDGLHPSNFGYAYLANVFIGVADTKLGLAIPALSTAQLGQIVENDPYDPFVLKSVNPESPFPLP
jgi:lysophospholipase L1-like esterase